jgi:hypothetical protein
MDSNHHFRIHGPERVDTDAPDDDELIADLSGLRYAFDPSR